MGMGMRMEFNMGQSHELRQEQKLALKQLLKLSLTLRHEGFDSVKGIEGLKTADAILKNKNIYGLLIGGLSEAVWNSRHTGSDFDSHKDVDVLIPDLGKAEITNLEGGIDWWLPREEDLKINYLTGTTQAIIKFWENAFDVRLNFSIDAPHYETLESGLYIPTSDFVIDMRREEAIAGANLGGVVIDGDVNEALDEKLQKRIKDEVAPIIKKEFDGKVTSLFNIKPFDHETVVAIGKVPAR